MARATAYRILRRLALLLAGDPDPVSHFHSNTYLRHNARRLEHLASLRIGVAGLSVLEVGAGIGDHSHYYIDRGCRITITEAREANLQYLRGRYPGHEIRQLDLDHPEPLGQAPFDVVHCYGVLYHLADPERALAFLASHCGGMLFLETRVSPGEEDAINQVGEKKDRPTEAFSGVGCRPTRPWLFGQLRRHFAYVYIPKTQPNHEEFPVDWTRPAPPSRSIRAIFIASREPIDNNLLLTELPVFQSRHA